MSEVYREEEVFAELRFMGQWLKEEDKASWRLAISRWGVDATLAALDNFVHREEYRGTVVHPRHLIRTVKRLAGEPTKGRGLTESEQQLKERYEKLERESWNRRREQK